MAVKFPNRCRSCKHFDLAAVQSKAGAVLPNKAARCLFDVEPILAQLPESVSWRDRISNRVKLYRQPTDGATCPQWEARDA